jgi:hypothetical protein
MNGDSGLENIQKIYENLTYFDQYGASVILFIIITLFLLIFISYCYVKIHAQPIIDDWANQRCKVNIIPFAGFITHPDGISAIDYTYKNFAECTQSILSNMTGHFLEPLNFIISSVQTVVDDVKNSINSIRGMFDKVRTFFKIMAEEVMGRILNFVIPLQQIIISFKDVIGKIQGTMTAGLFTLLGSYYALKSLLGAIAQFIITILITLAVLIAIFWILPFTWGAAISNTVIFIAIAIPLAIMLAFMSDVLKVQTGLEIPSIKCFDENTLITMQKGLQKRICEIKVGDILFNKSVVTSVMKVDSNGSQMYTLNGIIVSDSHIVQFKDKWVHVSKHPEAKKYCFYDKPYLYCFNTTSKTIEIKGHIFTDWDEIYDKYIDEVKNNNFKKINELKEIHTYLDGGFDKDTDIRLQNGKIKKINNIQVNDVLENGEKVYGIVEINGDGIEQFIFNLGKNTPIIGGPNLNICEPEFNITSTLNIDNKNKFKKIIVSDKLYHLLTDKKTFTVENIKFYDYNASIDLLLERYRGKLLSMKYV